MSDKLGPIEIEFVLDKQADEQAKKLKTSLDTVGTSSKKSVVDLKVSIKGQKELIKSIEQDVKNLQKAYDNAAASQAKSNAGAEVGQAKRSLREEKARLVGLQKEQAAANEAESSTIGRLVGKIGIWAAGLVTVGAAMKITKSIIASTEGSAHKFEVVVAEATAGVGYFFKSIASGDWSNFGTNLEKAIKGAKDYVDAMEVIANKQNEQKVKSSELDKQISELRGKTYDKDNLNNEKRKATLEEIIRLEKEKYLGVGGEIGAPKGGEAGLAKETYETNLKNAATQSGLAKEQIENFITQYSSLEKMVELGERYNSGLIQRKEYSRDATAEELKANPAFKKYTRAATPEEMAANAVFWNNAEQAGEYAKQISKVVPETRAMLSGYLAAANEAESAFGSKNRRDKMQLAEVTNKIKDDAEAKAKAVLQIKNDIEALKAESIDIGSEAADKGIKKELILIENKYKEDLLKYKDNEEAKILLVEQYAIERLNILKKYNSELADSANALDPGRGFSILDRAVNRGDTPHALGGTNKTLSLTEMNQLRKANQDVIAKNKKDNKEITENEKDRIKNQKQLVMYAVKFTEQLASQLNLSQEQAEAIGVITGTVAQLAKGDYIGAALGILAKVIGVFGEMKDVVSEPVWKKQINAWDELIKRQERVIQLSERTGGTGKALMNTIALNQKTYDNLMAAAAHSWERRGSGPGEELAAALEQAKIDLEDSKLAYNDFLTGGITSDSIAAAISQGFEDGKSSAADFADTFNDYMSGALNNNLEELSKPAWDAWNAKFAESVASGGGLTDAERAKLKADWDKNIADDKARRDEAYKIAGITPPEASIADKSMSGAIKGITEETASVLAGQVNAIRISQATTNGIIQSSFFQLTIIAANTEYCKYLKSIDEKIGALKTNSLRSQGL